MEFVSCNVFNFNPWSVRDITQMSDNTIYLNQWNVRVHVTLTDTCSGDYIQFKMTHGVLSQNIMLT